MAKPKKSANKRSEVRSKRKDSHAPGVKPARGASTAAAKKRESQKPAAKKTGSAAGLHRERRSSLSREERNQRIKDLVKLAEDQGYLTFDDINEIIPESVINPEELEGVPRPPAQHGHRVIESVRRGEVPQGAGRQARAVAKGRAARHLRRSDPHVPAPDGPSAAADPRAGSGDLQADRGSGDHRAGRFSTSSASRAEMYLGLADRLETGEERFDRVIEDKFVDSRDKYFAPAAASSSEIIRNHRDNWSKSYARCPESKPAAGQTAPALKDAIGPASGWRSFRAVLLQAEGDRVHGGQGRGRYRQSPRGSTQIEKLKKARKSKKQRTADCGSETQRLPKMEERTAA